MDKYSYKENNNKNQNKGILMILREIKILNFSDFNDKKEIYIFLGESEINIYSEKNKELSDLKKFRKKININDKGNILSFEENESYCLIDYKYHYKNDNFLIISFCNNGKELFKFKLNHLWNQQLLFWKYQF